MTFPEIYYNILFYRAMQRFAGMALHLAAAQRDKLNTFRKNAPTHRIVF